MSKGSVDQFYGAANGTRVVTGSPINDEKFLGFTPDSDTATIQELYASRPATADDNTDDPFVIENVLDYHIQDQAYTSINRGTIIKVRPPYTHFTDIWFGSSDQIVLIF